MTQESKKYARSFRNYLLNPKYQLRYTLIMVLISSLIITVLGMFWYSEVRKASTIVELGIESGLPEADQQLLSQQMRSDDQRRLWLLIGCGVLFAVAVAGYGIVLTHKVAGPLFNISRHMRDVRDGKLFPFREIRRKDKLHEFFELFRQMHTNLRDQTQKEIETLGRIIDTLERHLARLGEQNPEAEDIRQSLNDARELRHRKVLSLGSDDQAQNLISSNT